jgi:hypothetical protein
LKPELEPDEPDEPEDPDEPLEPLDPLDGGADALGLPVPWLPVPTLVVVPESKEV